MSSEIIKINRGKTFDELNRELIYKNVLFYTEYDEALSSIMSNLESLDSKQIIIIPTKQGMFIKIIYDKDLVKLITIYSIEALQNIISATNESTKIIPEFASANIDCDINLVISNDILLLL